LHDTTVTLNANESLGFLTFTNHYSFFVTDNNNSTLTFNNYGYGAVVTASDGSSNTITAPVLLSDNLTISLANGGALILPAVVANTLGDNETITLAGEGELVLSNANTYGYPAGTTGTTLEGGVLQVDNDGSLGAGDVSVTANSTLQAGARHLGAGNSLYQTAAQLLHHHQHAARQPRPVEKRHWQTRRPLCQRPGERRLFPRRD
jgi:hypothetical protein